MIDGEGNYVPGEKVAPLGPEEPQKAPRAVRVPWVGLVAVGVVGAVLVASTVVSHGSRTQSPVAASVSTLVSVQSVTTTLPARTVMGTVTATATARMTATRVQTRTRRILVAGPTTTLPAVTERTVVMQPPVTVTRTRTVTRTVTRTRRVSRGDYCSPLRPYDSSIVGGIWVYTLVLAEKCLDGVWVYRVESDGSKPFRVLSAELWRTSGVRGVRSARLPVDTRPDTVHMVWVWRALPARRLGYAGWVRLVVQAGGETRVVAIHI